ncbi:MAG TPA: peptide ABC transporter substrate-binding protein [Candidatus Krumholzibacteria bacterium]|nr:peptide ABC transporter substrate-binding protein [Candidatus Krumholzibacteria bacterium]
MLGREPESLDPGLCSAQPGGRILSNAFEGLCSRDPVSLAPGPGVARSWEIDATGTLYTFHLRANAHWSDGRPVTSHDFQFAWTRLLTPSTAAPYADLLYPLVGARAFHSGQSEDPSSLGFSCPDDTTFVVRLSHPVAYFLDLCAYYPLFPVPAWTIQEHGERWTHPQFIVSNGPYRVQKWQINRRVRLLRNSRYWDASKVALRIVDIMHGDDANSSFNRYESGELDWVDSEGIPPTVIQQISSRPDFHRGPYLNTYFLRFCVKSPPMDDPRVRKAFALAVNAEAITEHVTRGGQIPAHSLVPPGLPGYDEVQLEGYQPERARELLAQAGYPGGKGFPKVTYLYNTSEAHRQIAVVLQQQWKRVLGVQVELRNMEWKVFMAKTRAEEYQIARGGWIGDYLDPNTFLSIWSSGNGNNRTGFSSTRYDSLLTLAADELDSARRMKILHECERIVTSQECIIVPIYYYVVTNLYDADKWSGLEPNLLNAVQLKYVSRAGGAP